MTVQTPDPETTTPPAPGAAPAWSADDLRDDPHAKADKARRVRDMFAAIAGKYDLNNRLHSFGRDQAWRRTAVKMAQLKPGDRVLDVACGTGDLTIAMEQGLWTNDDTAGGWAPATNQVIGIDFTFPMLPLAKQKNRRRENGRETVAFLNGDALALPFPDQSFDVVSIAFGLRNVADPAAAVAEFARVLRPGGRLVILEFSTPRNPVLRWGSRLYCEKVMPWTATWVARDRSGAYRYLPRSVATFLDGPATVALLKQSGFAEARLKSLSFGVATCYAATRA